MDDFSIDLETLHFRYNSAIIAIGVVKFDIETSRMISSWYREIDFDSAIRSGRVSGSTLAWWMQQDEKAKRIFSTENKNKAPLAVALDELREWMLKTSSSSGTIRPWGNGATFDITILEHAYDNGAVGLKEAWRFQNIRDMRTIVDAANIDTADWPFPATGVAHNALDDAARQAQIISAAWQKVRTALGLLKPPKSVKQPVVKSAPPTSTDDDEEL